MAEENADSRDESAGQSADGTDRAEGPKSIDISETTAPSIGPNTVISTESAEDRLARHEQSDTDAMGLEKRREVIGGSYSASRTRQAVVYATVIAVVIGGGYGLKVLAGELDKPDAKVADQAPWTGTHEATKPLQ